MGINDSAPNFDLALRAFALMTRVEQVFVLTIFGNLKYPSIADRFAEAVYRVVKAQGEAAAASRAEV